MMSHAGGYAAIVDENAMLHLPWRAMASSFNGFIITGAPVRDTMGSGADPDMFPILYVNPAFEQITGYAAAELIGHSPLHILQTDERNLAAIATLRQALQEARECRITLNSTRKDGDMRWVDVLITPVRNHQAQVTHYIGIINDVTKQRETRMQRNNALLQLQRLSAHLQNARENERAHIARELHDELGQILTALKMDIAFLHTQYPGTRVITEKLGDMTELVDTTLASVRRISADLRPVILDDLGLRAALEGLARDFEKRHPDILCQRVLELEQYSATDHDPVAIACYRIVQECLTNVVRHAQASKVHIMVTINSAHHLRMAIQDNGCGLPESLATNSVPAHGFGLIGMRERVAALGGHFSLVNLPGEGLSVDVTIPLPQPQRQRPTSLPQQSP